MLSSPMEYSPNLTCDIDFFPAIEISFNRTNGRKLKKVIVLRKTYAVVVRISKIDSDFSK